jgi:hypothetical protein
MIAACFPSCLRGTKHPFLQQLSGNADATTGSPKKASPYSPTLRAALLHTHA